MMKILGLICILFASTAALMAQSSDPPQFRGLMSDSSAQGWDDLTCGGKQPCPTWTEPDVPALGRGYSDPTWGTTAYRLAVPPCGDPSGFSFPAYSKVQSWNSDGTLMFTVNGKNGGLILYDAQTTPPTPINCISVESEPSAPDGMGAGSWPPDAVSNDANWANTDPHRIYYQPASGSQRGTQIRYIDVGSCTPAKCTLPFTVVHEFSCETDETSTSLPPHTPGNKIETGSGAQGGFFDQTDRYFSFTCDRVDGAGRHEIDVIRYDRVLDKVTHQDKWYKLCKGAVPQGCRAWYSMGTYFGMKTGRGRDVNLMRMFQHADSRYIVVGWQATSLQNCPDGQGGFNARCDCVNEETWSRGCGVDVFDANWNFLGGAAQGGHPDSGFDIHGKPVFVSFPSTSKKGNVAYRSMSITDLTQLDPISTTLKGVTHVSFPCSFSYVNSGNKTTGCVDANPMYVGYQKSPHLSMTGRLVPGWGLISVLMLAGPHEGVAKLPYPTALTSAVTGPGVARVGISDMTTISENVLSYIEYESPLSACKHIDITNNVLTVKCPNALAAGIPVKISASGAVSYLNGQIVTVTSASPSSFTANYVHAHDDQDLAGTTGNTASFGTINGETVKWTAVKDTTATATFTKPHPIGATIHCLSCSNTGWERPR